MKSFVEHVHTPEALESEINRIYSQNIQPLVVGSLGRAAAFSSLGFRPDVEFQERGQDPLFYNGISRDIDVIEGLSPVSEDEPFEIDKTVFNEPRVRIVRDGTDWFLLSDKKNFQAQLHEAVMEPVVSETVYGVPVTTVPIRTHLALFGLKGLMGKKVVHSRELTMRLASVPEDDVQAELYEPFAELKLLDQKGIYPFLQRHYRALVPEPLRIKLEPVITPLKQLLP